jgi:hypothetical protein
MILLLIVGLFSLPAARAAVPRVLVVYGYHRDPREQQQNSSASSCPTA